MRQALSRLISHGGVGTHDLWQAAMSVLASLAVYVYLGVGPALVIITLVLLHEAGHYWALIHFGYRPLAVRLRPFSGGSVVVGWIDEGSLHSAFVTLAGPLCGVTSALILVVLAPYLAILLALPALIHVVYVGATVSLMQNVLNLLPIALSDGTRLWRAFPSGVIGGLVPVILLSVIGGAYGLGLGALACLLAVTLACWQMRTSDRKVGLTLLIGTYGLLCLFAVPAVALLIRSLPLSTWLPLGV